MLRLPHGAAAAALVSFALAQLGATATPAGAPTQEPTAPAPKSLGPGPAWRGPVRPAASNEVFATGNGCSMCHAAADTASALRSPTGDDVSPHALWQATAMANAFRDPYWRATVAKETAARPEEARAIESLCLRCHAPMAHHTAALGGVPSPTIADAAKDPLARDGVSCTVCHKIEAEGLGTPATWSGSARIGRDRHIYGPFADPAGEPMKMHAGYEPTLGAHVQSASHCGSCHTLLTRHAPEGPEFPEQTPFLEWRNSVFSDEPARGPASRTCQECHMPEVGDTKIARNPMGRDFLIPARPFRAHAFVGGNAFLLEMLDAHRDELGVEAPSAALKRMAAATRSQLTSRTATVTVSPLERSDGRLRFDVAVENLTGHKFPTGYPSRRAFLHVVVRAGTKVLFESGAYDSTGAIAGIQDELAVPHRDRVQAPEEVVVWELVGADASGAATTQLTAMASRKKDNRILPKGWRAEGPHADLTAPVGVAGDGDFGPGRDVVHFDVPLPAGTTGNLRVLAWLNYQTIPPRWVADLRGVDAEEAKRFVAMFDAADRTPEVIAIGQRIER